MQKAKKLIAFLLALSCICTMLPSIVWAEDYTPIVTSDSATVTEDFSGAEAILDYAPSTNLTGVVGYKENSTAIDGAAGYGIVGGRYMLTTNTATGSWIIHDYYDETTSAIQKYYKTPYQPNGQKAFSYVHYPYPFTGLNGIGVTGIKSISGKLYTTTLTSDHQSIIYNYKDAGNFDMVVLAADTSSQNVFCFRFYSYRTLVDTAPDGTQYKKVYSGRADQGTATYFELPTENIDGKDYTVINFTLDYLADGIKVTVTDGGENSASCTKKNTDLQAFEVKNVLGEFTYSAYTPTYQDKYTAHDPVFDMPLPTEATMAGLAVYASSGSKYVDDLSVTYNFTKGKAELVQEFTTRYATLLAKDSITEGDAADVENALSDYDIIVDACPEAATDLQESYGKLMGFLGELVGEITPYGAATVTENFDGTNAAPLVYEPSTYTTGSSYLTNGNKADSSDAFREGAPVSGVSSLSPIQNLSASNYGITDGKYKIQAIGNNGWFSGMMDTDSGLVFKCFANQSNTFALRYAGMDPYGEVTGIQEFSGTVYSNASSLRSNGIWNIVYNYIDNGNFDYLSVCFDGSATKGIIRPYSVRTVKATAADGTEYKKIYSLQLANIFYKDFGAFETEEIGGVTYNKMGFKVVYNEDGVTITLTINGVSHDITIKDTLANNASLNNSVNSTDINDKLVPSTLSNNVSASKATQVGFGATSSTMYADDVSVKFTYKKSQAEMVGDFNTKYATFLAREVSSITEADSDKIQQALADYATVVEAYPAAATVLEDAYNTVNGFAAKLAEGEVEKYFTQHGTVFASGFVIKNASHTVAVRKAAAEYTAMAEVTKDTVNEMAVEKGIITQGSTMLDYFKALTGAYYYNGEALIYDDFNSYLSDEDFHKVWEDVCLEDVTPVSSPSTLKLNEDGSQSLTPGSNNGFITVPKAAYRPEGMLKKFSVTMELDTTEFTNMSAWYDLGVPVIHYAVPNANEYKGQKLTVNNNKLQTTYGGSTAGLNENFPWTATISDLAPGKYNLVLSFEYEYVQLEEPGKPTGFGWTFSSLGYDVSDFIRVYGKIHVVEMDVTVNANSFVVPLEGKTINKNFTAGIRKGDRAVTYKEISYTYAKAEDEFSEAFEAYASTYGKPVSSATAADLDSINAAIALYETLTEKQQSAYAKEKAALDAMKPVAQFHKSVSETAVTPATDLQKLSSDYAALGVTSTAIETAIDAVEEGLKAFAPSMRSATIKATNDQDGQRLRFSADMPKGLSFEGYTVKEFGVIMLPNQVLGNSSLGVTETELKLDGSYGSYQLAKSASDDGILPAQFRGYLVLDSQVLSYGVRIAARAYIIYTVENVDYIYYSTNTSDNYNAQEPTKGVSDGVAVRSAKGIATAMAEDLLTYYEAAGVSEYMVYTDAIPEGTAASEIKSMDAQDVLDFVIENAGNVELISTWKNSQA